MKLGGQLLAKTLKVRGSASLLDMCRNVFVSTLGSNSTDVANSVNGVMVARLQGEEVSSYSL